ncbi:clamp loader of DNA polymerase [Aeromonas phage GomatiRiver_11]|nr:sliding-clamp-loader subunit [Aeromonas phage AhFM11]WKW84274.1 clamp loader of DNA polymerase [Aeromonas phage GomatiRiver_11]
MNLNFLMGDDEQLNEHEIAWRSNDWDTVAKLADGFKEDADNVLFNLLSDITYNKTEQNVGNLPYDQWFINNALSQHTETIYYAYVMNLLNKLPDQAHYNYLVSAVRKGKQYGKWAKLSVSIEEMLHVNIIKVANNVDENTAKMYLVILTKRNTLTKFLKENKAVATPAFIKKLGKTQKDRTQLAKLVKAF